MTYQDRTHKLQIAGTQANKQKEEKKKKAEELDKQRKANQEKLNQISRDATQALQEQYVQDLMFFKIFADTLNSLRKDKEQLVQDNLQSQSEELKKGIEDVDKEIEDIENQLYVIKGASKQDLTNTKLYDEFRQNYAQLRQAEALINDPKSTSDIKSKATFVTTKCQNKLNDIALNYKMPQFNKDTQSLSFKSFNNLDDFEQYLDSVEGKDGIYSLYRTPIDKLPDYAKVEAVIEKVNIQVDTNDKMDSLTKMLAEETEKSCLKTEGDSWIAKQTIESAEKLHQANKDITQLKG